MNDSALEVPTGAPPGTLLPGFHSREGVWRAVVRVLRSPASACSSTFNDVITTVFPADCRACGGPLLHVRSSSLSTPVCDDCLSHLLPQSQSIATALCRVCGEALGMESDRFASPVEGLVCTPCRIVPPPFERTVAFGVYENELREMVHLLKYDRIRQLAKPLGEKLAEAILMLEFEQPWANDLAVVAVPLFAANERARGFNQSVLLADVAITALRALRPQWRLHSEHRLLRRIKATESQFNLSPGGRRRNMIGAFKVQDGEAQILGRNVLLVDDIYTTGATVRACAGVLRRAGARRVWVATLARAQREAVALWDSAADDFG